VIISYLDEGLTLEAIELRDPLQKYHQRWGQGFMEPAVFLRIIYLDLSDK